LSSNVLNQVLKNIILFGRDPSLIRWWHQDGWI